MLLSSIVDDVELFPATVCELDVWLKSSIFLGVILCKADSDVECENSSILKPMKHRMNNKFLKIGKDTLSSFTGQREFQPSMKNVNE